MHSAVLSDWRTASAPNAITASTSYSSKYLGPLSISTHQRRHTSKSCVPTFRIRCDCGNRQRIKLAHKAVPRLLVLKDVCALFKSPWPSLFVLMSSHGGRSSGQIRCSSSVWRRSSPSANASGEAQPIEELWEEYFANPSQWWDNRDDKRNPKSPDFKHKVTRKALWADGWSTPAWVRMRLKSVTPDKLQSHAFGRTNDSQDAAQPNSARELRQVVQGGDGRKLIQSTTTTSEALAILKNLLQQGITIGSHMYVEVLKRCLKQKDLIAAKHVHDCIIKSGMEQDIYVATNLLSVYIRCGRLQNARRVFDELLNKNIFSWTVMIGGYAQENRAEDAMDVLNQMRQEGVQPNEVTYLSILKAFASPAGLKWGKEVHAYIRHDGLESDLRVANALVHMYARTGSIDDARLVFDGMGKRDVTTWTILIGGLAQHGRGHEAYELFLRMQQEGCVPNAITYMSILNPCASAGALEWVKDVHSHVLEGGLETDLRVGNALIHMYAKSGSVDDARLVFDRMGERDVITWNTMIGGLADHGRRPEAYEVFLRMQRDGLRPDAITYVSILNACASAGSLEWVKEVHKLVVEAGLESDLRVGNALLHSYAKSGSVDDAGLVFDRMGERNVITWTILIGGLAEHGRGPEAYELFLRMKRDGFRPDAITYVSILNACASDGALDWVKEVHMDIMEAGLESDLLVASALVRMYAKSGSVDDARLVFDRMEGHDVIIWNIMIGGLAEHGRGPEAYELFLRMKRDGFRPDAITYVSILNACASAGALDWVKEVHMDIMEAGLESDLLVASALVRMYAKSGSVDDARLVFDRMEGRDVIIWNIMIGGLAENGRGPEAYELFLRMKRDGFRPDVITYVSILKACASAGALEWVKEVHMDIMEAGLESDLLVASALVRMYAKTGSVDDARLVFDRMEGRDVMIWNIMIGGLAEHGGGPEAYELFLRMKRDGFRPDAITYVSILNACASDGAIEWVKEVHMDILEAGLESDLLVASALVRMYAKSGSVDDARLVFDRMEGHDLIIWNIMIGGLAEHGGGPEAYELFLRMKRDGFRPDAITYVSILNACASDGAIEWVKEVHMHIMEAGLESDLLVASALVRMYSKSGSVDDARLVFDRMEGRDVMIWNIMIGGLAENGRGPEAYELFLRMRRDGFRPDAITYVSILNACASAGALEWVKDVHMHILEAGLESDLLVASALVRMYAKSGSVDDARLVFDRMEGRDVMIWNIMIGGLAENGRGPEAYELFLRMKRDGFRPDAITYMSILNACASAGALEWVKDVHMHILEAGLESDLLVASALIHMYAKSGGIDDARLVFDRLEERVVITWNVWIGGLARHGLGHEALECFSKMNIDGVKPDEYSFVSVLSACSHAGLVDEGRRLFSIMFEDFGIKPIVMHCTCMVDLLGRAGHLDEAKRFIDKMPIEPDGATWGALLGACRTHGNVELGELAASEVSKLRPKDASPYVLLSNIYAAAGKWEEVSLVRAMMQERGIRKEPGRSWIEVDGKIHDFVVGDVSHPEAKEIYAVLNRLTGIIKAEGYIPDTRLVLQNIDEEAKELALCYHSEKLAIAFGLMHTPRGKPIRVYKNLRVCSDCHTATKFISKVTGREIVARDANRFHHFKDGMCSCGDYW